MIKRDLSIAPVAAKADEVKWAEAVSYSVYYRETDAAAFEPIDSMRERRSGDSRQESGCPRLPCSSQFNQRRNVAQLACYTRKIAAPSRHIEETASGIEFQCPQPRID